MKAHIYIDSADEIQTKAAEAIELYERPPKGFDPNREESFIGEDGFMEVLTDELEVETSLPINELPEEFSVAVDFIGWDETYENLAKVHGIETHEPAIVALTLKEKWRDHSGNNYALYAVTL